MKNFYIFFKILKSSFTWANSLYLFENSSFFFWYMTLSCSGVYFDPTNWVKLFPKPLFVWVRPHLIVGPISNLSCIAILIKKRKKTGTVLSACHLSCPNTTFNGRGGFGGPKNRLSKTIIGFVFVWWNVEAGVILLSGDGHLCL